MSTRLTKGMREYIIHKLISKTFDEQVKALTKERTKMADAIYKIAMPENFLRAAKKLPAEYFATSSCFKIKIAGGYCDYVEFPLTKRYSTEMSAAAPFPAMLNEYGTIKIPMSDEIKPMVQAQIAKEQSLESVRADLKDRITNLVFSVTTIEKLREVAPELNDYLPEPEAKSTLPAVQIGSLVTDLMAAGLKIPAGK